MQVSPETPRPWGPDMLCPWCHILKVKGISPRSPEDLRVSGVQSRCACAQACAYLLVSLLQSRIDSMMHDPLITVGLVPRQLSALFLGIRRQQLTQNRSPPSLLKESSSCIWKGAGRWLGRFVLVISKLPHALCTSVRAQDFFEHSACVCPSLIPSVIVQEAHWSPLPVSDTQPLGMASIVRPRRQPSGYRQISGL